VLLAVSRVARVQGAETDRRPIIAEVEIHPTARIRRVEHVSDRRKVHTVNAFLLCDQPVVRVAEEEGLYVRARDEYVEQGLRIREPSSRPELRTVGLVMYEDNTWPLAVSIQRSLKPAELLLPQEAGCHIRLIQRVQQEEVGALHLYHADMLPG
jgi:hypothetical protein